jgi:hypothetical protein
VGSGYRVVNMLKTDIHTLHPHTCLALEGALQRRKTGGIKGGRCTRRRRYLTQPSKVVGTAGVPRGSRWQKLSLQTGTSMYHTHTWDALPPRTCGELPRKIAPPPRRGHPPRKS